MNAYGELQTSGNSSVQTAPVVLHTAAQVRPRFPRPQQGMAMFEDLERQMLAFQIEHEAALKDVRRFFVLPPDASVLTFLNEHRTIPQVLLEAATHLRASFTATTIFNLRVPIDESGSRALYAVVVWPGAVRDVRAALDRFDEAWWISHSRQTAGYLAFTYELV